MGSSIITRRIKSGEAKVDFNLPIVLRRNPNILQLSSVRCQLVATSIGNYALFGGGYGNSPSYKDTVDVYLLTKYGEIQLYPGTKYKFEDMEEELTSDSYQIKATFYDGYIKVNKATINY